MHINSFEKRIRPKRIAGFPEPYLLYFPVMMILAGAAMMVPVVLLKLVFGAACAAIGYTMYLTWSTYDDWLIRAVMVNGKRSGARRTFGVRGEKLFSDEFTWKTFIGGHALSHSNGAISCAIEWEGIQNRFFSDAELISEHKRRVALLKSLPSIPGLCVEHHFFRESDTELADAYIREGEIMASGKEVPPIVVDIRTQVADLYRPYARSNGVLTVISLGGGGDDSLISQIFSTKKRSYRDFRKKAEELQRIFDSISGDYSGAKLLTSDQYQSRIQQYIRPHDEPHYIDWRYNLSDQIITEKPQWVDGCLKLGNIFYKVCLLQNYPELSPHWFFGCCEGTIDTHVSQIILPKNTDKALDDSKKDADYEGATISGKRGTDRAIAKHNDQKSYRAYVSNNNLPVADNAYVVTFMSKSREEVISYGNQLRQEMVKHGGRLRDDHDLQIEMFRVRLPGLGRETAFSREDHADTICGMMPFTTFPAGERNPESLRVTASGMLVGFSPSKLEVAHELVVAETGGGKDTQYGLKILETYLRIRYDIIEMGNSYQGVIEAIGGRYCRAKEQVINPLSSYSEYNSASGLVGEGVNNIAMQMIRSQSDILLPIFKGIKADGYTRTEEVVLSRLIQWCYENPSQGIEAPTLPILSEAMGEIIVDDDQQERARDAFDKELNVFLLTPTGSCFKEQDQFVISPVANAIDFDKFEGELFQYFLSFTIMRFANSAMASATRNQIILNEYKVLLQRAPKPVRAATLAIDRMGRKDWVGLTRITQGIEEIRTVDSEAINSIPNKTLLSRKDQHHNIGELLRMPASIVGQWEHMHIKKGMDFREGVTCEHDVWYRLYLKFPELLLDLMNTQGRDKPFRDIAYSKTKDPYERIALLNQLKSERDTNETKHLL